jgi:branched-subunit amino acid ABC-type transport system permease component
MFWGDRIYSIRGNLPREGIAIGDARITGVQLATVVAAGLLSFLLSTFLSHTKVGRAIRAVGSDPELADTSGINSNAVVLWAVAIGSAIAGLAGMLVAADVGMTPTMGMNPLMMGVVAVIIGGTNSTLRIALSALLLAMVQHIAAWFLGSQWQGATAFAVLIIFLLFKPEGFSRPQQSV